MHKKTRILKIVESIPIQSCQISTVHSEHHSNEFHPIPFAAIYTGLKNNVDVPALLKKYLTIDLRKDRKEGEEPGWIENLLGGEKGTAGKYSFVNPSKSPASLLRENISMQYMLFKSPSEW